MKYKKIIPLSWRTVLLVLVSFSMRVTAMEERHALPFYIPELRLAIVQFLLRESPFEEALSTLKAWSLLNKCSLEVFKKKEDSVAFIQSVHTLSQNYNVELSIERLKRLSYLLHKDTSADYETGLCLRTELSELFKECKERGSWELALRKMGEIQQQKKMELSFMAFNSHWEGSLCGIAVKKNLITKALELEAPDELLKRLIETGAYLKSFHPRQMPPLLSALIAARQSKNSKVHCQSSLKNRLSFLIEAGACVNDSFFDRDFSREVTPLYGAVLAADCSLIRYLQEQGAYLTESILHALQVLLLRCKADAFCPLLEVLLDVPLDLSKKEALIAEYIRLEALSIKSPLLKESRSCTSLMQKLRSLLSDLLRQDGEKNRAFFLGVALRYGNEERISFLSEQSIEIRPGETDCFITEGKVELFRRYFNYFSTGLIPKQMITLEAVKILTFLETVVCNDAIDGKATFQALNGLIVPFMHLDESIFQRIFLFLRLLEIKKLFSFSVSGYGSVASVFHYLTVLYYIIDRSYSASQVEVAKRGVVSLIRLCKQHNMFDSITAEGKTAACKAHELDMHELVELLSDVPLLPFCSLAGNEIEQVASLYAWTGESKRARLF